MMGFKELWEASSAFQTLLPFLKVFLPFVTLPGTYPMEIHHGSCFPCFYLVAFYSVNLLGELKKIISYSHLSKI